MKVGASMGCASKEGACAGLFSLEVELRQLETKFNSSSNNGNFVNRVTL